MSNPFWLSQAQMRESSRIFHCRMTRIVIDDRRVISGIIQVLQSGCRWRDCPEVYGPCTTI